MLLPSENFENEIQQANIYGVGKWKVQRYKLNLKKELLYLNFSEILSGQTGKLLP